MEDGVSTTAGRVDSKAHPNRVSRITLPQTLIPNEFCMQNAGRRGPLMANDAPNYWIRTISSFFLVGLKRGHIELIGSSAFATTDFGGVGYDIHAADS